VKKRFTQEQIIGFLREAEAGLAVAELCRRHGFSEASYYLWRSKFGGMNASDAKRLKAIAPASASSLGQGSVRARDCVGPHQWKGQPKPRDAAAWPATATKRHGG